jgi:hypothetical protein
MGFFGKIKEVFSGSDEPKDEGIYIYVRLDRSDEIVQLRLTPQYELVPNDEGSGYTSRKHIVGPRTFKRAEAVFTFDSSRQMVNAEIDGGELAAKEDWLAQQNPAPGEEAES